MRSGYLFLRHSTRYFQSATATKSWAANELYPCGYCSSVLRFVVAVSLGDVVSYLSFF